MFIKVQFDLNNGEGGSFGNFYLILGLLPGNLNSKRELFYE